MLELSGSCGVGCADIYALDGIPVRMPDQWLSSNEVFRTEVTSLRLVKLRLFHAKQFGHFLI